jgi:hypothetical protein
VNVKTIKPLYRVSIARCIDGKSFDVEMVKLSGFSYAITPGRWLHNRDVAERWVMRQVERELWKSLRRWKNRRPFLW